MTDTDPAAKAAQHALDQRPWIGYDAQPHLALLAAQEALNPLREKLAEWYAALEDDPAVVAHVALAVLDDLKPLIAYDDTVKAIKETLS